MNENQMMIAYDRRRTSDLVLDEQPGAHTGATRKVIPGFLPDDIVYLDLVSGNDAWTGANRTNSPGGTGPKLTQASATTAAGSTKKIILISANGILTGNVSVPTEVDVGLSGSIIGSLTTPVDTFTESASIVAGDRYQGVAWSPALRRFAAVGFNAGGSVFAYSSDGITWLTSPSVIVSGHQGVTWSPELSMFVAVGNTAASLSLYSYSYDGINWTASPSSVGSRNIVGVAWSPELALFTAVGVNSFGTQSVYSYSSDGITWEESLSTTTGRAMYAVTWSPELSMFVAVGGTIAISASYYSYSYNGIKWLDSVSTTSGTTHKGVAWSSELGIFVAVGGTSASASYYSHSIDGLIWVDSVSTSAGRQMAGVSYSGELKKFLSCGGSSGAVLGVFAYSSDGLTWTNSTTTSSTRTYRATVWGDLTGKIIIAGYNASVLASSFWYSSAYSLVVSSSIAGFSIQAASLSGTIKAYNCTFKQLSTTASFSTDNCQFTESGGHISNNAQSHYGLLFAGAFHITGAPANSAAVSINNASGSGILYIHNSSETGYEQIRGCAIDGGIQADFPVTVSGRSNTRGTSTNVNFDSEVTHNDPKFVDADTCQLQFQSNDYPKNSLLAGRSNIYFNSAGAPRDVGAWSYVETNVGYYYNQNGYVDKPQDITHEIEEVVNEQQGDTGEVSVYGNVNRVKEAITFTYGSVKDEDRYIFNALRTLNDKSVKVVVDPEFEYYTAAVTVNGAHSIGDDVLNIDAAQTFSGFKVTIAGKEYYAFRSSPDMTATTKLILNEPLQSAVADNTVLVANYPAGDGEYQYSANTKLALKRVDSTVLTNYKRGFSFRLVRKYQ